MKEKFIENGIEYVLHGDYYLPNLSVPEEKYHISKYGMMRRSYLQKNRKSLYSALILSGKLHEHLHEIDEQAQTILEQFIKSAEQDAPNKATQQMEWVGYMNNVKKCAEELIYNDIIYI